MSHSRLMIAAAVVLTGTGCKSVLETSVSRQARDRITVESPEAKTRIIRYDNPSALRAAAPEVDSVWTPRAFRLRGRESSLRRVTIYPDSLRAPSAPVSGIRIADGTLHIQTPTGSIATPLPAIGESATLLPDTAAIGGWSVGVRGRARDLSVTVRQRRQFSWLFAIAGVVCIVLAIWVLTTWIQSRGSRSKHTVRLEHTAPPPPPPPKSKKG